MSYAGMPVSKLLPVVNISFRLVFLRVIPEVCCRAYFVPKYSSVSLCSWLLLLRGTIVNRTYGIHKNLYI